MLKFRIKFVFVLLRNDNNEKVTFKFSQDQKGKFRHTHSSAPK